MSNKKELVRYLLQIRQQLELETVRTWSQSDLSEYLDIPEQTITHLLDPIDSRMPSQANADRIAIATGSNRIHEITGTRPTLEADPDYARFLRVYKTLPPDERKALRQEMRDWLGRFQETLALAA